MADTTHTIEQDIARIKEDVTSLKTDMGKVKEDVTSLKTDMGKVKEDMTSLKMDMTVIKAEMKYFATKEDLQIVCTEMEHIGTDIEHMGRTLIMWHVSSMIALVGIITAIFRFMR